MAGGISSRKAEHLDLCAHGDVGFRGKTTLLEEVQLVHDALPELGLSDLDTRTKLFGKTLAAPLFIAAMTGGTEEAGRINVELARLAEELGLGFGLGSQRAMHVKKDVISTYRVRDVAPTTIVLGNIGVVQARDMSSDDVAALAREVSADALCVHLNPAMELVQSQEGDRDFRGCLSTLRRLAAELRLPIIAKETGSGISRSVGLRLRGAGIAHVDVSGGGGTSWVGVETARAARRGDVAGQRLGETFWNWGIPTAACIVQVAPLGFATIIATGGIESGLDVARALALGAHAAGIARPVLKAFDQGGPAGAKAFLESVLAELRAAMLLTGCRTPVELAAVPRLIGRDLAAWYDLRDNVR